MFKNLKNLNILFIPYVKILMKIKVADKYKFQIKVLASDVCNSILFCILVEVYGRSQMCNYCVVMWFHRLNE